MPDKIKNSEKEVDHNLNEGETEQKKESPSWDEIDELMKEINEKFKLTKESGNKLEEEANKNESLTEKDREKIEKATEQATNEAEKAEIEAKEQIAQATGETIIVENTENQEKQGIPGLSEIIGKYDTMLTEKETEIDNLDPSELTTLSPSEFLTLSKEVIEKHRDKLSKEVTSIKPKDIEDDAYIEIIGENEKIQGVTKRFKELISSIETKIEELENPKEKESKQSKEQQEAASIDMVIAKYEPIIITAENAFAILENKNLEKFDEEVNQSFTSFAREIMDTKLSSDEEKSIQNYWDDLHGKNQNFAEILDKFNNLQIKIANRIKELEKIPNSEGEREEKINIFLDNYVEVLNMYKERVEQTQDIKELGRIRNGVNENQADMTKRFSNNYGVTISENQRGNQIWDSYEGLKKDIDKKIEKLKTVSEKKVETEDDVESINRIAKIIWSKCNEILKANVNAETYILGDPEAEDSIVALEKNNSETDINEKVKENDNIILQSAKEYKERLATREEEEKTGVGEVRVGKEKIGKTKVGEKTEEINEDINESRISPITLSCIVDGEIEQYEFQIKVTKQEVDEAQKREVKDALQKFANSVGGLAEQKDKKLKEKELAKKTENPSELTEEEREKNLELIREERKKIVIDYLDILDDRETSIIYAMATLDQLDADSLSDLAIVEKFKENTEKIYKEFKQKVYNLYPETIIDDNSYMEFLTEPEAYGIKTVNEKFNKLIESLSKQIEELEKEIPNPEGEKTLDKKINEIIAKYEPIVAEREAISTTSEMAKLDGLDAGSVSKRDILITFEEVTENAWDKFKKEIVDTRPEDVEAINFWTDLLSKDSKVEAINNRFDELVKKIEAKIKELGESDEEKSELTEQEQEVKKIIDEYAGKVEEFETELKELKNRGFVGSDLVNTEVKDFKDKIDRKVLWGCLNALHNVFEGKPFENDTKFNDAKAEMIDKITKDELRIPFEKFLDDMLRIRKFEVKITEAPPDENKDESKEEPKLNQEAKKELDENLKKGFEVGDEVVVRKVERKIVKGKDEEGKDIEVVGGLGGVILEPGWKIVELKEGSSAFYTEATLKAAMEKAEEKGKPLTEKQIQSWRDKIPESEKKAKKAGIAVIEKDGVKREISTTTLHESNKSWKESSGEIAKATKKGAMDIALSWAGLKFIGDIRHHRDEKKALSKLGSIAEDLSKFTNKSAEKKLQPGVTPRKRNEESRKKVMANFKEIDAILEKTKESASNSNARKKIAQMLQLTKTGEMLRGRREEEIKKITEVYLSQKTSGMQVARESVNSALTVAARLSLFLPIGGPLLSGAMLGVRAGIMMPIAELYEKKSRIEKSKWQEAEKDTLEKSVFKTKAEDVKKTTEKIKEEGKSEHIWAEAISAIAKEAGEKAFWRGKNKTKFQKSIGLGQAWGTLIRYVGYGVQARYGVTLPNVITRLFENQNLFTGGPKLAQGHFDALGKNSDTRSFLEKITNAPKHDILSPQEHLVERFPGLRNQTGGKFTAADAETGIGHTQYAKTRSILVDFIDKNGKPGKATIPFTDPHKNAADMLNSFAEEKGIDPDRIANVKIGSSTISEKFIPGVNQETDTSADTNGSSAYENLDAGEKHEIQRSVGNTVQKYNLEHKDLIYEGNKMVIHANVGGKDTPFEIPVEKGDNDWNLLRNFYSNHPDIKAEDITSVEIEQGDSEFAPGDLPPRHIPTHETGHVASTVNPEEIHQSAEDILITEKLRAERFAELENKYNTPLHDTRHSFDPTSDPSYSHPEQTDVDYSVDSKTAHGTQGDSAAVKNAIKEYPAYEPAFKFSSNIDSFLYNGNIKAEKSINELIEQIDQQKRSFGGGDQNTIDKLTDKIKTTVEENLIPKEYNKDISRWLDHLKKDKQIDVENIKNYLIKNGPMKSSELTSPENNLMNTTDQKLRKAGYVLSVLQDSINKARKIQ
ncbi:MAG: hypothetical protein Q7R99_04305 [bacterium]|nr:hypothetical protein [bacterium]